MKNSSMPMLKVKLMRRNGSASARTSGEALAKSSRDGASEIADRPHHRVHRDRGQQRLLDGAVDLVDIAGADIARHQHGLAGEERRDEDDDDEEDLPADADGGVAGVADQVADQDVIDHALQPGDHVLQHGRPRQLPNGGADGAFDERPIERGFLLLEQAQTNGLDSRS